MSDSCSNVLSGDSQTGFYYILSQHNARRVSNIYSHSILAAPTFSTSIHRDYYYMPYTISLPCRDHHEAIEKQRMPTAIRIAKSMLSLIAERSAKNSTVALHRAGTGLTWQRRPSWYVYVYVCGTQRCGEKNVDVLSSSPDHDRSYGDSYYDHRFFTIWVPLFHHQAVKVHSEGMIIGRESPFRWDDHRTLPSSSSEFLASIFGRRANERKKRKGDRGQREWSDR